MKSTTPKICRYCEEPVSPNKKWGYANICEDCDEPEKINKSMAVIVSDGKTDYHTKIIRNPTRNEVEAIKTAGKAHDPRTQLRAINKVSR